VAAVPTEFFSVFGTNQVVPFWSDFDYLAQNAPSGSVWVLDEDVIVDFKGCESVGSGVIEVSAFLPAGSHTVFQLLWLSLPFVNEGAVVRRKTVANRSVEYAFSWWWFTAAAGGVPKQHQGLGQLVWIYSAIGFGSHRRVS
jgi:hypothetical protein